MSDQFSTAQGKPTAINVKNLEERNGDNYSYSAKGNKFKSFQILLWALCAVSVLSSPLHLSFTEQIVPYLYLPK